MQSSGEEDILHLHWYKWVRKLPNTVTKPSIDIHDFPLLTQSSMQEVFETMEVMRVRRSSIIDGAFVLAIERISDGKHHCIGINNAFLHFSLSPDGSSILPHCKISEPVILCLSK